VSFTVGDWLVEPRACRVSRGDTVEKLRPQLVDVLVCLAKRPGEIVLKDEILSEVWPGQFIAESGLSRCIAELRQVLQDDAQQPRFIETILKRGYRLMAPVVWAEKAERADTAPVQAEPGPEVADGGASQPAPASAHASGGGRRTVAWRRGVWVVAAVGLLATGIVAVAVLTRSPASVLTERDTVLLADVNNATRDPVFDHALRLALAVNLEQAPLLRILPQEAVRAALVRAGRSPDERVVGPLALEACRREGAAVLLAGSITPLGSRYAIGLEAIACGTGESLGHALAEADSREHVLTALEQAATRIREKLGESRDSLRQHDVPLVRATTPSLEALRALTLGDVNRDHARLGQALPLYRQATELDPAFALAWARRGAAAWNLSLEEEAIPAFRRAYELRDRVSPPEGFYIAAHYYRFVEGDPQKTIEAYQAWKRMYPGSAVPPTNLASILSGLMGQYDAALPEAREAVRLAPYSSLACRFLVLACRGSDRIAEAKKVVADAMSRGIDDPIIHAQLLNLALIDGNRVALEREIRWASGDPMAALLTSRLRASAAMAGGRLREARRLWLEALARADEIGPARRVADVRLSQAEAEALVGDPRAARVAAEAALSADKRAVTLVRSAIVFALVGDPARGRALLDDAARQVVTDAASLRVWLPVAESLVVAGLGRADDAMGILKPVARFERGSEFGLVPLGVRALVQRSAHRVSDAAVAFDELIRLRPIEPASPWVVFARLGLARALREAGDPARSLEAYDAFLDSWKDADPEAPLLKVARRERAAVTVR
jgi:DNA-binding winged helix-turn-helix (wHTH) protein/tetratricopeptide (TPR) repeat protein